jgi:Zn ribbon nucleic-acid-binding protein
MKPVFFCKEIKTIQKIIKAKECNHKFILDMIDINVDKSINITYCVKCGFTK